MTGQSPRIMEFERLKACVRELCAPLAPRHHPSQCSNLHNTKIIIVYGFTNPHKPDYLNTGRLICICQTSETCSNSKKFLTEQPVEIAQTVKPILARIHLLATLGSSVYKKGGRELPLVSYPWFEMGESQPGIDDGVPHHNKKGGNEYTTVYPFSLPKKRDPCPKNPPHRDTLQKLGAYSHSVIHIAGTGPSHIQDPEFSITFGIKWYYKDDIPPVEIVCTITQSTMFSLSKFDFLVSTFRLTWATPYELFVPWRQEWKLFKNWDSPRLAEAGATYFFRTPGVTSCLGFRSMDEEQLPHGRQLNLPGSSRVPTSSGSKQPGKRKRHKEESDDEVVVIESPPSKRQGVLRGNGTAECPHELSE